MMRLLLAAGADPKLVTGSDTTAVMAAAGLNHLIGESPVTEQQALEAVKLLLELGVPAGGVTSSNENALFGPAYRGWNTLLALLIEKGADVNVVSKAGITPWLAASGFGDRLGGVLYNKEGADLLLKHEANPTLAPAIPARRRTSAGDDAKYRDDLASPSQGPQRSASRRQKRSMRARHGARRCARRSSRRPVHRRRTRHRMRRRQLRLRALVAQYRLSCHNERLKAGNLQLDTADANQVAASAETWEKVIVKLRSRAMPPAAIGDRTTPPITLSLRGWRRSWIARPSPIRIQVAPQRSIGSIALNMRTPSATSSGRRSTEHRCCLPTSRHMALTPRRRCQSSPALLDRYLTAATTIARLAIGDPTIRRAFERYGAVKGNPNEQTRLWQTDRLGEDFPLGSRGDIAVRHFFPVDGEYRR